MSEWPDGMTVKPIITWPGVTHAEHVRSNFSAPWTATLELLNRELWHLEARDIVLQVAIEPQQFRLDGYPRAGAKQLHPGIILTMTTKVGPLSYPCDTYATWRDNLRAIALALEALRKVDRYGVTKHGEQYQGFAAIEARPASEFTDTEAVGTWLRSLVPTGGVVPNTWAILVRVAKRLAHPDQGGDTDTFDRVMRAEAYLREQGVL